MTQSYLVCWPRIVQCTVLLASDPLPTQLQVSLFLDCPEGMGLHCPNASAIAQFEAAVKAGDIW